MTRAPYLARREDGRYYLQVRLGKMAAELYGPLSFEGVFENVKLPEAKRRLHG